MKRSVEQSATSSWERPGYFYIPEQGHWSSSLSLGTGNMETSLSSSLSPHSPSWAKEGDDGTLEFGASTG